MFLGFRPCRGRPGSRREPDSRDLLLRYLSDVNWHRIGMAKDDYRIDSSGPFVGWRQ